MLALWASLLVIGTYLVGLWCEYASSMVWTLLHKDPVKRGCREFVGKVGKSCQGVVG